MDYLLGNDENFKNFRLWPDISDLSKVERPVDILGG